MALDGLTLGFIARELDETLTGGRVDKVQQPEKDMVVLLIRAGGHNHRLLINANPTGTRLHLTDKNYESPLVAPVFTMLMRKHLLSGRVTGIRQMFGDRLLRIDVLSNDEMGVAHEKQLYFEAMGRHSNLSLVQDGIIIDCLRHVTDDMSRVRRMLPGLPFELPPAQDKLPPEAAEEKELLRRLLLEGGRLDKAVSACVSGIGAGSARELCLRLTGQEQPQMADISMEPFARQLAAFLRGLPDIAEPQLYTDEHGLEKDALPFLFLSLPKDRQQPAASLSAALDTLYYERDLHDRLMQRTAAFRRSLKTAEERALKKLAAQEEELASAARMEEYRVSGELLTAFGSQVPKGAREAQLPNYYDNGTLKVELDPALSAAQNAQKYFKRYRKAAVARRVAAEQKEHTLKEIALIEDAMWAVEQAQTQEDIAEIKEPLRRAGIIRREAQAHKKQRDRQGEPLRFVSPDGFEIVVGKNSLQNERLLKWAAGNDLWLHAKDMPGSHVILRTEGREATETARLAAARLAAFYSKGRGRQVPVNYTLRKYVRKPGGTPEGFVTFSEEKLLIVSCEEHEARALEKNHD